MISHQHRCIFIHIPGTAGTAIETAVMGCDWGDINRKTKHLLASQAKALYRDHWESYFKFAFVRNPWDRMVSLLRFPKVLGVVLDDKGKLNIDDYLENFGYPVVAELDYRYHRRADWIDERHRAGAVFLNTLDEELDFIGRFENLDVDIDEVFRAIGLDATLPPPAPSSIRPPGHYSIHYSEPVIEKISEIHARDLERFGYSFESDES